MTGRTWAYLGAALGGAVSIAANVAHSYVPPPDAPATWTPDVGAVVSAVFWPLALFVVVEILARVAWPDGTRYLALRLAGLLPVALVAAVVSYRHMSGLLAHYGEDDLTAALGPVAVDGLMVMATGALIATGARIRTAASEAGELPAPVDTEPPTEAAPTESTPPAATGTAGSAGSKRAAKPSTPERVARAVAKTPEATPAQIAARLKVSERTVQRHWPRPEATIEAAPATLTSVPSTPSRPAAADDAAPLPAAA